MRRLFQERAHRAEICIDKTVKLGKVELEVIVHGRVSYSSRVRANILTTAAGGDIKKQSGGVRKCHE